MHRSLSLLLLGAALWGPLAHAQDLTVERDGDEVAVTLPDGTTHRFTVDEGTPLRLRIDGDDVAIEHEGRRLREAPFAHLWRDGDGPRSFAFRFGPDELREFEAFAPRARFLADSLVGELRRFHPGPGEIDVEAFAPWPGFGMLGVSPELRRDLAEAERESHDLARRARQAEGAEQDRLRRELRTTLERAFDLKLAARRERLEHLRQNAAELDEELAQREAARREIIERRERELLGEQDGLDW